MRTDKWMGTTTADDSLRLERLRAVAAQVLEHSPAQATGNRSVVDELSWTEGLSPVARGPASPGWAASPVVRGEQLRRAALRQGIDASMLLRRSLSLWRSSARSGAVRRHATAQRLLQEELQKKREELRVTVSALEHAVTVAQDQLALVQSKSEKKIHAITLERDSLAMRCKQLEAAAEQSVVVTEDPAPTQQRLALLADQRRLAADREELERDRLKLRQLQMSLVELGERKQLEHLPLEDALERTRRARLEDSRVGHEKQLMHQDRLVSNLAGRVARSHHRRQIRRCVAAWREDVATAQRRRILGQRAVVSMQRATKRRSMASWIAMIQNSRRAALANADKELATALADLAALRSSAQYTAAQEEAAALRRQVSQAAGEAEAAKRLQATTQQELSSCRAQILAASTQHIAKKDARTRAVLARAVDALKARRVRASFGGWADATHKVTRARRLIARAHARMTRALLTRTLQKWVERWRGPMVPLSQATEAQDISDMASFTRAANHAAAETTIQLLEQQLHTSASTAVAAEMKREQAMADLEAELVAAREAATVESRLVEQSAEELLLAKSALADATDRYEAAQEQTKARMALVTQDQTAVRKQVIKLKQEQQGLKLALKLAQISRLKQKDHHVELMMRRNVARTGQRLLRTVVRHWLQECWRARLVRSEQLFSQLALLAEAQSAAVGLLEDEAGSAAAASLSAISEKTKAIQLASESWETQKVGWSRRCVRMRDAAHGALALHCVFGVWKFFLRVQMARRAAKQSWLEHDRESSTRIQSMEFELEGARAKLQGLNVLSMDAGQLGPDELMVLLVEAAEELAAANQVARSGAKPLKHPKADADRQLQRLSVPAQSWQKSPPRARVLQMNSELSRAATANAPHTDIAQISATSGSPGALNPFWQNPVALPSSKSSMDDAGTIAEQMGMHQPLSLPRPKSMRPPAPAFRVQESERSGAAAATAPEASQRVAQKLSPHHGVIGQGHKKHAPSLAEGVPPTHGAGTTLI